MDRMMYGIVPAEGDGAGWLQPAVFTTPEKAHEFMAAARIVGAVLPVVCDPTPLLPAETAATSNERPAARGELCTCGRQATVVYSNERFGDTGYCGRPDGGDKSTCVFCGGAEEHLAGGRCPRYRLRLEQPSITCPVCERTSYNPNDIREKWCGACAAYHPGTMPDWLREGFAERGEPLPDDVAAADTEKRGTPPVQDQAAKLIADDPDYYAAARDSDGNIRLSNGNGLIIAHPTDTRADLECWIRESVWPRSCATYMAALRVFDREDAEKRGD